MINVFVISLCHAPTRPPSNAHIYRCVREREHKSTHAHKHTRARTPHAHAHTRTHTRTDARTHARTVANIKPGLRRSVASSGRWCLDVQADGSRCPIASGFVHRAVRQHRTVNSHVLSTGQCEGRSQGNGVGNSVCVGTGLTPFFYLNAIRHSHFVQRSVI